MIYNSRRSCLVAHGKPEGYVFKVIIGSFNPTVFIAQSLFLAEHSVSIVGGIFDEAHLLFYICKHYRKGGHSYSKIEGSFLNFVLKVIFSRNDAKIVV